MPELQHPVHQHGREVFGMKTTPVDTGSLSWAHLHVGVVSAGEADNLLTPKLKEKEGKAVQTYLYQKAAEVFRGKPLCDLSPKGASSWQMDQGIMLEEDAIPYLEFAYDWEIKRGLFCTTDDGLAGCTPDGLIGEDIGLEIKCPEPHSHVGYLLNGGVPDQYAPQVAFSLYVTGRKEWKFVSFRKGFPALLVTVERDEETMELIDRVVKSFHAQLTTAVEKLRSLK